MVARKIEIHLQRGEWSRAFTILEDAQHEATQAWSRSRRRTVVSFETLGLDERTIGRLTSCGIVTVEQLASMSGCQSDLTIS